MYTQGRKLGGSLFYSCRKVGHTEEGCRSFKIWEGQPVSQGKHPKTVAAADAALGKAYKLVVEQASLRGEVHTL